MYLVVLTASLPSSIAVLCIYLLRSAVQCSAVCSLNEIVFFFVFFFFVYLYLLVVDCYEIKGLERSSRYRTIVSYRSGKILPFLFFCIISRKDETRLAKGAEE